MAHFEDVEPKVVHETHGTVFQRIIVPFLILTGLTALEFIIAFTPVTMVPKSVKVIIFIVLTLFKAFYIMAYFMHVKFERLTLIYSVTLPFLFVVYLLVLLMLEGSYQSVFEYYGG